MAEDSTRKLLRTFGVAMTDCEDAVAALAAAVGDPAAGGGPGPALETYGKAAREVVQRWTEVSRLILDYQVRAQQAIEAHVRGRGA